MSTIRRIAVCLALAGCTGENAAGQPATDAAPVCIPPEPVDGAVGGCCGSSVCRGSCESGTCSCLGKSPCDPLQVCCPSKGGCTTRSLCSPPPASS